MGFNSKMFTIALAVFCFLPLSTVQGCGKDARDVDLVVQVTSPDQTFTAFSIPDVIKLKEGGQCWKVKESMVAWSEKEVIANLAAKIDVLSNSFFPGSPKRVIFLVLGGTLEQPDLLLEKMQSLMELNCFFVVVGVDLKDSKPIFQKYIEKVRLFNVDKLEDISSTLLDMILEVFRDPKPAANAPDGKGPVGQTFSSSSETDICWKNFDIGFIMDDSGSITPDSYNKEKRFIVQLVKHFHIGRSKSRVGLIQFSRKARLSIKLNRFDNVDAFSTEVLRAKQMKQSTRIDLALKLARDELFTENNGGRKEKEKVIILITDGIQSKESGYTEPELIANDIRRKFKAHVFVVSVGTDVDAAQLGRIGDNVKKASDFNELNSRAFVNEIARFSCPPSNCEQKVDICFLVDSSGSINENTDFRMMKEFVERIADTFKISRSGARGGLVLFSDYIGGGSEYTRVESYLTDNDTPARFRRAVQEMKYIGYRTRIDLGFKLAEEEVFNPRNGGRPNVKKIIILLTDGRQTPRNYDPVRASKSLHDQGVSIYAVGIGKFIDHRQLEAITRDRRRVFNIDTFEELLSSKFVAEVSQTACDALKNCISSCEARCSGQCHKTCQYEFPTRRY